MDTVPSEILHDILSYVPESSLGLVRLVNHVFNTVANERYFQTIRVPFTTPAIEYLRHLSHRPHLAQHVQHLIYPYERLSLSKREGCLGFLPWNGVDLLKRKTEAADPVEVSEAVKSALSKMPNIKEITTNLDANKLEFEKVWPESSVIRDESFYIMHCKAMIPSDKGAGLLKAFNEMMAAAYRAQLRLEKLTIHSIWRGIFTDKENILWSGAPLFRNVTSLTVFFCTIGIREDFDTLWEYANDGRIFKFLSSAHKLKELSLGIHWRNPNAVIPLFQLLGESYVWEQLETFCFNGTPFKGEEMMNFWARHSLTLKTFNLYYPCLSTGTWREMLDFIVEQPGICLKNLNILRPSEELEGGEGKFYWREDDWRKMNEYVLRGGPPFPLTEAELEAQGLQLFLDEEESLYH